MKVWLSFFAAAGAFAAVTPGLAAGCSAQSGERTVALIELYTSEGCDSCPPADRWLRALPREGITPDKAVPLALHVDYWDYIGWKDPYARPLFSERQKEAGEVNHASFVYTPQVLLAGRDFRRWSAGGIAGEIRRINAQPARASISLEIRDAGAGRVELRGSAGANSADRADAALFLVFYESGLSSQVKAGENRGTTLEHDFVAREWSGPVALGADGRMEGRLSVALAGRDRAKTGAAAFVQNRKTGEVLQALALPMCPG